MNNYLGLYIHIPFCHSKCPYCDFYSIRGNEFSYTSYVNSLKNKIEQWGKKVHKTVDTVYFGGGTPSVIGACAIHDILSSVKSSFKLDNNCEITIEVNPESGRLFDFEKIKSAGVNRISLGVQSADTNELKKLGRLHNTDDVKNTVSLIKCSEIDNISMDLMLGIPCQTRESLKSSIDFCVTNGAKHISAYILKLEKNTVFYRRQKKLQLPDDDYTADLYLFATEYLKEKGFVQYEISNFSLPGYESRHNLKYWELENYLGIGPDAHSYLDGKRFYYDSSITGFENDIILDEGSGGSEEEYIMLQLRLAKGLNTKKYKEIFGHPLPKDFFENVNKYERAGLIHTENNTIHLTPKGFLVSNTVISHLI